MLPMPSMIDQPDKFTVEVPVLSSSIHSPFGNAAPSALLLVNNSANSIGDGVEAISAKFNGLVAFGVGYAA